MCKASIPSELESAMTSTDQAEEQFKIGVEHAKKQADDLLANDIPGIHYYVLNKSDAAEKLLAS